MKALRVTAAWVVALLALGGLAWWTHHSPESPHIRFVGVSTNGTRPTQVFEMVNPSAAPFCYEGSCTNDPVLFFKEQEGGRWREYDLRGCFAIPMVTLEPGIAVKFTVSLPWDNRVSRRAVGIRFYPGKADPWGQEASRFQTMWAECKFKFQAWIGYTAPIPPVIWSEVAGWK